MAKINSRITLKHDTEEKWNLVSSSFIPLGGEIVIYDSDDNYDYPRFKIGDGSSVLADLPFCALNGEDGYTPVRGTDYWTDADKAEIKSYVDDAILNGEW